MVLNNKRLDWIAMETLRLLINNGMRLRPFVAAPPKNPPKLIHYRVNLPIGALETLSPIVISQCYLDRAAMALRAEAESIGLNLRDPEKLLKPSQYSIANSICRDPGSNTAVMVECVDDALIFTAA